MTDTRARLLSTAADLFQRQGFNGTSIKQITDGAGATTGSLYHFFPGGKDELAAEAITASGAEYLALFEAIASVPGTGAGEAVVLMFDGASGALEQSDYTDACPIFTVAHEVASANEPLRVACQRVFATWTATAAALFRADGFTDPRAEQLATTVVAALGGAFILARTARNADHMRTIGRDLQTLIEGTAPAGRPTRIARRSRPGRSDQ
jgi:TetR/AcrR family transcriptional repressor of lmrAB and yxaGH operons